MKNTWKKNEFDTWFKQSLDGIMEPSECQEVFLRLLEHHGISRLDWVMIKELDVDETIWASYVSDLKKEKPIQYVLGYEYFAGEKFLVNEHVLIPRPETEELVQWVVAENDIKQPLRILEIGTGSGCIAISLKKRLPLAEVLATDLSEDALQVAQINAQDLNIEIDFLKDDILDSKLENKCFDLIVSNPPYIPIEEAGKINKRVKEYEPHMALFTEKKNPLQFYKAIIDLAIKSLDNSGSLYFEVHEDYAAQVSYLAQSNQLNALIRKDIYGKNRMIKITKDEH